MEEGCHGWLLFKRTRRKTLYSSRNWKFRYFRIEQGVLFCCRGADWNTSRGGILRAIALSGCTLTSGTEAIDSGETKHKNYLLLKNFSAGFEYHMRADTDENYKKWKAALLKEINVDASFPYPLPSSPDNTSQGFEGTYKRQQKRWLIYSQQNKFITDITDICERLRFIDRPLRPSFMVRDIKKLKIPPFAYIPLANSNDTYSYCLRAVPSKAYAFRTKARCPILMYFETEEHPAERDIATFLSCELHEYPSKEILLSIKDVTVKDSDSGDITDGDNSDAGVFQSPFEMSPSRINLSLDPTGPWRASGTGLKRVNGITLKPEVVVSPRLSGQVTPAIHQQERHSSSSHFGPDAEIHCAKARHIRVFPRGGWRDLLRKVMTTFARRCLSCN